MKTFIKVGEKFLTLDKFFDVKAPNHSSCSVLKVQYLTNEVQDEIDFLVHVYNPFW